MSSKFLSKSDEKKFSTKIKNVISAGRIPLIYHIVIVATLVLANMTAVLAKAPVAGTDARDVTSDPEVTVAQGKLRGQVNQLGDGTSYYSFKGIPYAEAPVGKLRFKAPVPKSPWQGVRDAKEHGPICPQLDEIANQISEGSEDCLSLNVYTKMIPSKSNNLKLPVMVFIHGGSFWSGSGNTDLYGPEYLVQHNVILVTLNYRLEALGFLSLDIEDVPGNAGLRDQALALKWVKQNIAQFGGDSNKITVFGESSGAGAVTYHLVSQFSIGLFNKAISQSGVFLSDWALCSGARDRAFRLAKYLGKETNDVNELLDFLQSVPATSLVNVTGVTTLPEEIDRGLPIHFCPVIEKSFSNVTPFLGKSGLESILSKQVNKVPLLLGYNSAEGIIMVDYSLERADLYNSHFDYKVPNEIVKKVGEAKSVEYGQRVKEFYFGISNISKEKATELSALDSDIHFIYNIHRFADLYKKYTKMPVYMYRFALDTELNIFKNASGHKDIEGACHADELSYLFDNVLVKDIVSKDTKLQQLVFMVSELWANFAKSGNNVGTLSGVWRPYRRQLRQYLSIDRQLTMGRFANKERVKFWNNLYSESGLPSISFIN